MNPDFYKTYTTEDFILDEDFREMVRDLSDSHRLRELLESLPEKQAEMQLAAQIINNLSIEKFKQSSKRKKELWEEIVKKQKRRTNLFFFRYAASVFLLIGAGFLVLLMLNKEMLDETLTARGNGIENTVLILANGESVSISSKQSAIKYSADGTGVMVSDSSGIAQTVAGEGLNRMIVPYGKRSTITLSDGTKVWLNSGSTLIFPTVFKENMREVALVGEAFFDVKYHVKKPFIVKTDFFNTRVYGTKFDVKAYLDDTNHSVVLVDGKVSMSAEGAPKKKEVFLAPNQKATLSKGKSTFEITEVENMETYSSWVDGYLTYTNAEVTDLLKEVSRYYNIEIEMENIDEVENIYGKLDLKDDLDKVLEGVAFISKTTYKKYGNKYVFY